MSQMTPQEIVHELDKTSSVSRRRSGRSRSHCATAGAAAGRGSPRQEITPKNILMIGPTGVARPRSPGGWPGSRTLRHQIEATKVHRGGLRRTRRRTIIRDLVESASRNCVNRRRAACASGRRPGRRAHPRRAAARGARWSSDGAPERDTATRQSFARNARRELDDREVEIEVAAMQPQMEILAPPG